MRLPVWLQGYALHPLILVFCLSIWSSSVTSQESPCHSSFGQCFRSSHRVIQPTSYSIVQGFQRPKASRSYDDKTYTSYNQLQYPNPWVGNTTVVWLKGGTGQLTDGFCASREFRSEDEQYPWVGWDSLRIDDDAQISPVPLYFTFGESISLTSIKIHTVSPMESGIKLFQRINVSITMDDDADFDKKVWMSVLTDITKPSDTSNTSTDLIVEFELPSGLPLARHVRIQLMASPNYSWIYVSEVAFCGQEFARQISISSAAVQYMVESEPGTVRCQADNVDSLELIHVTSGRIVMNSSSAPQTLTVADSIMTPTVPEHDGQKYICRGNNSVVNAFNQTIIKLSVAEALDIFRASYHRSVAPGQSVLLQCCVKDNRRRAVKPPISWVWVDVATRARLAETSEPYVLVNNITASAGAAVASYSCTVRSTGYRDYTDVAIVAISGTPAPQTGRYSNMLQNDLCAETYLPNTESPSSATTDRSPGGTWPGTSTTGLADLDGISTSTFTESSLGKLATWIIIGLCCCVVFLILALASVLAWHRKLRNPDAKLKMDSVFVRPGTTENIAYEPATQASSMPNPNDAYGLHDERNDPNYSYITPLETVASTTMTTSI